MFLPTFKTKVGRKAGGGIAISRERVSPSMASSTTIRILSLRTRSGKIGIIETMGDYPANEETLAKLHLGRAWQAQAGPGYRYFLVFRDKDISMSGAYPMSEFLKIPAEL